MLHNNDEKKFIWGDKYDIFLKHKHTFLELNQLALDQYKAEFDICLTQS